MAPGEDGQVDASSVFRNHNYNLPLLRTWIDELLSLTEKTSKRHSSSSSSSTTEDLVESLHKYDAVFRELIQHTKIFSVDLTKLYGKLWSGVLKLLDAMVKIYHRHVTQTSSLQEQAKDLIRQRHAQVAATNIDKEQGTLERTALRANIRNLEAEILALKTINREMDRENRGLRILVDTYIDGRDFNPTSLTLVEKDMDDANGKKRSLLESFKSHFDLVNSLEIQMNEKLVSIEKEDDRQKTIIKQLTTHLNRNKELILAYKLQNEERSSITGFDAPVKKADVAIQVDEKQAYSLVIDESCDDEDELFGSSTPKYLPGIPDPKDIEIKGKHVPYQIRDLMGSFSEVLRVPSVQWTCQTIFNIYASKADNDIKYDKMFLKSDKKTLGEYVYEYYLEKYGLPAVADSNVMVLLRACEVHAPRHRRVQLFCDQIGLFRPDEEPLYGVRDTDFILQVIRQLKTHDEFRPQDISKMDDQLDLTHFVQPYVRRTSALATAQTICEKWGLEGAGEYVMKVRAMPNAKGSFHIDFDEFMEISVDQWVFVRDCWLGHMSFLFQYNSSMYKVQHEAQFAVEGYNVDKDTTLVQITRDSSLLSGSRLTPRLLREAAFSAARKIAQREKQLAPEDTRPSSPGGTEDLDLSLTRPTTPAAGLGEDGQGSKASTTQAKSVGQNNIVQMIPHKKFHNMMKMVKPKITREEVDIYFEACREYSAFTLRRELGRMWIRCEGMFEDSDGVLEQKAYYFNRLTGHSQWALPFRMKTFRCPDVTLEAFSHVMLLNCVMESSPLHVYYHLAPPDLWPNTEIFYKEVEMNRNRSSSPSRTPASNTRKKPIMSDN